MNLKLLFFCLVLAVLIIPAELKRKEHKKHHPHHHRDHEHGPGHKDNKKKEKVEDIITDPLSEISVGDDDDGDDDDRSHLDWLFDLQEPEGLCNPNPCRNNGVCEEKGKRKFKCNCAKPYKGKICEKGPKHCKKGRCGHGECVLISTPPFYECKCKQPFQPPHCINMSLCEPNPCRNGGQCINNGTHVECKCPPWFRGRFCHVGPDDCYDDDVGASYRGNVSETDDGYECLYWNSHFVLDNGVDPLNSFEKSSGLGPHNFCRNPDGERMPWCFFRKGSKLSWDYCEITKCPEPTGVAPTEIVPAVTDPTPSKPKPEPTTPSKPIEPTTPSKPIEPTTPSKPIEPTTPSEPIKPTTPSEPIEPTATPKSIEPKASSETTTPSEPIEPTATPEPIEPTATPKSIETKASSETTAPSEPIEPTTTEKPSQAPQTSPTPTDGVLLTTVPPQQFSTCGKPQPMMYISRIFGGLKVSPGALPWQVSLQMRPKGSNYLFRHMCGGVLIASCWVLTAAHCGELIMDMRVVVGALSLDLLEPTEQTIQVEEAIVHEYYMATYAAVYNDIALLRLKGTDGVCAIENEAVKAACLPDVQLPDGMECKISGWGATEDSIYGTNHLLEANVLLINQEKCSEPHIYGNVLDMSMICAGHLEGGVDSCQGDSGGPLTCEQNGTSVIYGLVSWGDLCGMKDKPGVYARVTHFVDWIKSKTQAF